MKDPTDKLMAVVYSVFGALLGFVVFVFALGGFRYVFLGKARSWWSGGGGLFIAIVVGLVAGWACYRYRGRELGGIDLPYEGEAGGSLFGKRLIVLATSVVALYYIWDLARGMR